MISFARSEMSAFPPRGAQALQREAQMKAVTSLLSAYGLLDDRPFSEQQEIVDAILAVFTRFDA
jgi:hypothetical protein